MCRLGLLVALALALALSSRHASAPATLPVHKRPFGAPAPAAVQSADVASTARHAALGVPGAVLAKVRATTAAVLEATVLAAVAPEPAHAAPRAAEHGVLVAKAARGNGVPAIAPAGDAALLGLVQHGEGDALAPAGFGHGARGRLVVLEQLWLARADGLVVWIERVVEERCRVRRGSAAETAG
jgi:hypothetical protein